jgi:ABC-type uncharacterized transport system YnjBCD substrate-binding protein
MPAQYVKAYVKRNKNDAADAAAICEAVVRPTMRFVAVKTVEQQAAVLPSRFVSFKFEFHSGAAATFATISANRGHHAILSIGVGECT